MAAFAGRLPGDWDKGALEEGIVNDVAFVILAFDDPIAGIGFALTGVGEDEGGVEALRGIDEKGSAGAKRVHEALLPALFRRRKIFQQFVRKKDVTVFVGFRKDFRSLSCSACRLFIRTMKRIWRRRVLCGVGVDGCATFR
jgi:hypothetical protein